MAHIDPLLAAGRAGDQPFGINLERGSEYILQIIGHPVDLEHRTVVVLEVLDHLVIPQAAFLELGHEVLVDHDEISGKIRLGVEVLVGRLNGLAHADDVGDGCGGRNGHGVAVAHAVFGDGFAHRRPVHLRAAIQREMPATLLFQQVDGINRQQSAIPFGSLVGLVGAALGRQFAGGEDGVVGDHLHAVIGKLHGFLAGVGNAQLIERILKGHHAHAHRAMLHVRVACLRCRVVVDVDHIVQHPDSGTDGLGDEFLIERAILKVGGEVHGAEVAHGGFLGAGVQENLGAEIGAVHHARVILRRADIGGILESDPRMARLEEAHQYLAPEILGFHSLEELNLARFGHGLVFLVAFLERRAVEIVQILHIARTEEGPLTLLLHTLHE